MSEPHYECEMTIFYALEVPKNNSCGALARGYSLAGPAEWWSKRCGRLRPKVKKKKPPNFKQ